MFEKMKESNLMFWSVQLLVIATLIFVSSKINFMFQPVATFFTTLFAPILIAGFFYYMLSPLVTLLITKTKIKKNMAIGIVFLLLIVLIILMIGAVIPNLIKQLVSLASILPEVIHSFEKWVSEIMSQPLLKELDYQSYIDKLNLSFGTILKNIINGLSSGIGSIVSSVASVTMIVVTVPFILFYMLKDGHRFVPLLQKYLPANNKLEIIGLLEKMSKTISAYISGQVIECLFVAICTTLGYALLGIEYAFLFGIIAGVANMIPYLGPYIGLAPAVFVTIFDSPVKALLACVVVLVVQQIDGNLVYPIVIGRSLDIHPLTIILVLLVAGNIAGLLGMILGVPFYAVCKTVVVHLYGIFQLKDKEVDKTEIKHIE